jgi:hypothetical protein
MTKAFDEPAKRCFEQVEADRADHFLRWGRATLYPSLQDH